MITPKKYETYRNELVSLLNEALDLAEMPPKTRKLLSGIQKRALENQFEIVLAGEFQGGKSTTFNAICDGRELSPAGAGIKTSGCLVSAQNIAEPDTPESAKVSWRTSAELTDGFSDLLLPHLQEIAPRRFEKVTASELRDVFDLNRPADRRLLRESAGKEWGIWKKDRAGYDPEQRGLLDVLRCASIIAHYFGSLELAALRGKETYSPEEIGAMTVFPQDWEARWSGFTPENFHLREVVFVFIGRVTLHLHSRNLGRLGCVITDCPGLFASRWDTETARKAMFGADAILYLADGSKTVKLSDLSALDFIRRNGMAHKLFFGCNMRGHTLEDSRRIRSAGMTALQNSGFDVIEDNFVLFHALLSLRAVQAERMLQGGAHLYPSHPQHESELLKTILRQLAILDIDAGGDASGLNADLAETARKAGGMDRLMGAAEQTVISRKARSILIENGSQLGVNCLKEAEGTLNSRETTAFQEEKEFRKQAASVEEELRRFRSACARIIDRLADDGPDYHLAEDVWARLEARRESLCETVTDRIYKEVVSRFSVSLLMKKRFQAAISAVIKAEIDAVFTETINAWVGEIREGGNQAYNAHIVRRIRAVSRELKHAWKTSVLSDMNWMAGTTLPEFSGDLEVDTNAILRELESGHSLENIRYNALLAAGGVTGIFTATSGVLVAVYILITRLFWVRIATVVVFIVNIVLMFLTKGMLEKSMRNDIRKKLDPALQMLFLEIREDVKTEFRKFSADIRGFYSEIFNAAVDRPRRIFEKRRKQAEADFLQSRDARMAIAREARRVREEKIMPLRKSLEDFTRRVTEAVQEAENGNADRKSQDNAAG